MKKAVVGGMYSEIGRQRFVAKYNRSLNLGGSKTKLIYSQIELFGEAHEERQTSQDADHTNGKNLDRFFTT